MSAVTQLKIWNDKLLKEAQGRDGLKETRAYAWKKFEETGFPNSKNEFWRYTSSAFPAANDFQFSPLPKSDARLLESLRMRLEPFKNTARIIFIDGWFVPQLSHLQPIAESVDFSCMRDLASSRPNALPFNIENDSGFSALNAALFQDGIWINVRAGAQPEETLLVYFLYSSGADFKTAQLRHEINLDEGAALKIIEWHDHMGDAQIFINQQMNIKLSASSKLEHWRLQQCGEKTWSRAAVQINLAQKSHYERLDFEAGALVSRNEIEAVFSGGESVCNLSGVTLGNAKQHFDTQVIMNHAVPAASSNQVYRNLLSGEARGVFGGKVIVCRDAQKTDAHQVHKTLLLSDKARADTKPQLEIDADDVQCSHGAAIGQLDEDSLFYLRSRGISRSNAEKMLASGFVEKILDSISDEAVRGFFKEQLKNRLTVLFQ